MVILVLKRTKFATKSYFRDEVCNVEPNEGWSELTFENRN